MRLGIIGCGAIGSDVAKAADMMKASVQPVEEFLKDVDVVFEAASQQAVTTYAVAVLEAKRDLIIMSIGSLFDDAFRKRLEDIARKYHRKIYLPSGAVCGIDGVLAARIEKLDSVTLVTTKPPASLGKSVDQRTVVYKGTARDAVKQFPRNINVAACLSLAGVGFDETIVEIVADPVETRISHKILAHGRFGRLRAEVENMPNPNNPQSSYMASLSAIAILRKILDPIQIV